VWESLGSMPRWIVSNLVEGPSETQTGKISDERTWQQSIHNSADEQIAPGSRSQESRVIDHQCPSEMRVGAWTYSDSLKSMRSGEGVPSRRHHQCRHRSGRRNQKRSTEYTRGPGRHNFEFHLPVTDLLHLRRNATVNPQVLKGPWAKTAGRALKRASRSAWTDLS